MKKRVVNPFNSKKRDRFKADFYAWQIARTLFPQHFLRVQAATWPKFFFGRASWISKLHHFDEIYEASREKYYADRLKRRYYSRGDNANTKHSVRLESPEVKELISRVKNAGIDPNDHPVNIAFENGVPVFIEIQRISPTGIREHVAKPTFDENTRARVLKLLKRYEQLKREGARRTKLRRLVLWAL